MPASLEVWRFPQVVRHLVLKRTERSSAMVRDDFALLNIKIGFSSLSYLSRYSDRQYDSLLRRTESFQESNPDQAIAEMVVGPPSEVKGFDFGVLPDNFIIEQISGTILDLRNVREKFNEFQRRPEASTLPVVSPPVVVVEERRDRRVERLVEAIAQAKTDFSYLAEASSATVEHAFEYIDGHREGLGFLNVTIYRPREDGKWEVFRRTRQWGPDGSKYDPERGGAVPQGTLKSVIEGRRILYDVNIKTRGSFEREGLFRDEASIANDLANSKGPGRMLFIKLVSREGKVEAVVHLHNRVGLNEEVNPPLLLPNDRESAQAIKTALKMYFDEAVQAIEAIRNRGRAERQTPDAGGEGVREPFSPVQYHGGSKMYRSGEFTTEYNGDPAKNYARIWPHVKKGHDGVVVDVLEETLPEEEMKDHTLYVKHSFTDRVGTEETGFATADEHTDYRNAKGKAGRLIYYAGIMVKKKYRGGRTAFLTFRMMLEIFKGLGWAKLLLGKTPLVYRTQDKRIHRLGIRYYSAKSNAEDFTEEDWNAMRFTAQKYEWRLEEGTNICRKVYNKKLVKKDEQLLPALGELDGKVCVGCVSWKSVAMLLWDVFVRKRVQFNGDNGKGRMVSIV